MPVPSTIDDLSTTASSNSPAGSDTPQDGDNYIRALSSFIAQLRDKLNGTSGATLASPVMNGTATAVNLEVSGLLEAEDLQVNSTATIQALNVLGNLVVDQDVQITDDLTVGDNATISGFAVIAEGVRFGNAASGENNRLDWYEGPTSFTPTLRFGGASVGITYNINTGGYYMRIGKLVLFTARVRLTAKGSSTGSATIAGLPYAMSSSGTSQAVQSVNASSMSGLTGALSAVTSTGSTSVSLSQSSATGHSLITDAVFTNTSDLFVTGSYFTD